MPVNSVENRLLLYAVDGDKYSPIALSLYDISIDNIVETDDSQSIKYLKYLQNPVSMTITLPHKKMSRKRFKKWLMHFQWIDRNEAEAYCCLIGIAKGHISYGATYHDIAFLINFERPGIVLFNSLTRQLKETEK